MGSDKLGWREVLSPETHAGGQAAESHRVDQADGGGPYEAGPISDKDRIVELEAQIARLKKSGRTIIAQREEWKARALAAEKAAERFKAIEISEESNQSRYAALKRILARELHPDYAQGDGIEKIIREAIFKRIWPQVEAIEKVGE